MAQLQAIGHEGIGAGFIDEHRRVAKRGAASDVRFSPRARRTGGAMRMGQRGRGTIQAREEVIDRVIGVDVEIVVDQRVVGIVIVGREQLDVLRYPRVAIEIYVALARLGDQVRDA